MLANKISCFVFGTMLGITCVMQVCFWLQIVHKNLIISSVLQLDGCSKVLSDAKANAVENEKRYSKGSFYRRQM